MAQTDEKQYMGNKKKLFECSITRLLSHRDPKLVRLVDEKIGKIEREHYYHHPVFLLYIYADGIYGCSKCMK